MSQISLSIPYVAAKALEKPSNDSFGVCVVIMLTVLAVLSVATAVAPIVDPVVFAVTPIVDPVVFAAP